jgi:glutamate dehydrogenase (NAD(P)+)
MGIQLRIEANDSDIGLRAYVVVDSLHNGRALGGTRMTGDVNAAEVAGLARAMTLKLALAGLPIGGAKAGITCDLPPGPERDLRIEQFGRAIAPLLHGGVYLGADQGITYRDRDLFLAAADYDICGEHLANLPCAWAQLWERCQTVTGHGVCEAAFAADKHLNLGCKTAVVQGFGLVGRGVATTLAGAGYRIVAVADQRGTVSDPAGLPVADLVAVTDPTGTIDRAALPPGVRRDDAPNAWLDVPTDLLVLAANAEAIHEGNVDQVRARLIVEGANLASTEKANDVLAARGVPIVPGIVANCGSATVTALLLLHAQPAVGSLDELAAWLFDQVGTRVRANVATLLTQAKQDHRSLARLALDLAEHRRRELVG